jgi:hypothetical protein
LATRKLLGTCFSPVLYRRLLLESAQNLGAPAKSGNGPTVVGKIDARGIITTVAGTGSQGYSGDGVPATAASMNGPSAVAVKCPFGERA